MKDLYPDLLSVAVFLECSEGRVNIFGSFPEQSVAADAYRRELLGLMEIHLNLLSMNKVDPTLQGRA